MDVKFESHMPFRTRVITPGPFVPQAFPSKCLSKSLYSKKTEYGITHCLESVHYSQIHLLQTVQCNVIANGPIIEMHHGTSNTFHWLSYGIVFIRVQVLFNNHIQVNICTTPFVQTLISLQTILISIWWSKGKNVVHQTIYLTYLKKSDRWLVK